MPQATAAYRMHLNGKTGITGWNETPSIAWTNDSDIELYEQSWRSPSGHAVTLLWAEIPDHEDDDEDDSSQREGDLPGFRLRQAPLPFPVFPERFPCSSKPFPCSPDLNSLFLINREMPGNSLELGAYSRPRIADSGQKALEKTKIPC